ncbi:MAG: acyl-CoA thioesterase [Acidimicrobiaceae bacterium]|nr:acyl-CoA thioesterase [Acidimicrobiaceae bacterium]
MSSAEEGRVLRSAASVEPAGPDVFSAHLSPFFTVMGHPHGGYLQCVIASAALAGASEQGSTHLHATAVSTNFVNAPEVGAAQLRVEVRRVGRGVSFVYVALSQKGELATESLVTLGSLRDESAVRYQYTRPFDIPPLEKCRPLVGDEIGISSVMELRLDPAVTGFWDGQLSSTAEVRGWLRLEGEDSWDAQSLLFAGDALPPATLPLGSSGWVPTVQLTSYVRRVPKSEWLRGRQLAVVIADGLVDQRCELFDETGQMVASSTQLALVRLPGGN